MRDLLLIDGSRGEGGGQVLRTALALSLVTGRPLRIEKIRARRKRPGLARQHLAAVEAAARVGRARVTGATLESSSIEFVPTTVVAGVYAVSVGSAGSTMLALQTILPALITASGPSRVRLEGGTHNPLAPPFEFVERCFLPVLSRMGPRVEMRLERTGFFPAGGGECEVTIHPAARLAPFDLPERGALRAVRVRAVLSMLPRHIAERELQVVRRELSTENPTFELVEARDAAGPGNVVCIEIESENVTEVFTAFGKRGRPAEAVAADAVTQARHYLDSGAPVGEHLADQLLVPLALARGGSFRTLPPTAHLQTNAAVIKDFLPVEIEWHPGSGGTGEVRIRSTVQG